MYAQIFDKSFLAIIFLVYNITTIFFYKRVLLGSNCNPLASFFILLLDVDKIFFLHQNVYPMINVYGSIAIYLFASCFSEFL